MAFYISTPYRNMEANRRMWHHMMNRMMAEQPVEKHYTTTFPVDVKEEENQYVIYASLPGVLADDLDIQIVNEVLTITGEIKPASEDSEYLLNERPTGNFSRSLNLPDSVASDNVVAELKNGVLTLTIPKAEEALPKKIKVNVN